VVGSSPTGTFMRKAGAVLQCCRAAGLLDCCRWMVSCGTTLPLDDVMLLLQGDVLLLLDAKEVVLDDVLLL
ncbi:hypothetical protein F444_05595, partial [Phytophthora nicotianae P1976]